MKSISRWTGVLTLAVFGVIVVSGIAISRHLNPLSLSESSMYIGGILRGAELSPENQRRYWVHLRESGASEFIPGGTRMITLYIEESPHGEGTISGFDLDTDGVWDTVSYLTRSPASSDDLEYCTSALTLEGAVGLTYPSVMSPCSPEAIDLAVSDLDAAVSAIRKPDYLYYHKNRWGFWVKRPPE